MLLHVANLKMIIALISKDTTLNFRYHLACPSFKLVNSCAFKDDNLESEKFVLVRLGPLTVRYLNQQDSQSAIIAWILYACIRRPNEFLQQRASHFWSKQHFDKHHMSHRTQYFLLEGHFVSVYQMY